MFLVRLSVGISGFMAGRHGAATITMILSSICVVIDVCELWEGALRSRRVATCRSHAWNISRWQFLTRKWHWAAWDSPRTSQYVVVKITVPRDRESASNSKAYNLRTTTIVCWNDTFCARPFAIPARTQWLAIVVDSLEHHVTTHFATATDGTRV